jgi:HlyD family secretion protein
VVYVKKQVKWVLWGAAAVFLAGFMAYSATRPVSAELLEIKPRPIEKKFREQGTVSALRQKDFSSLLGGKVLSIMVSEGDRVKTGDLLLSLDTREISYQIAQLEGQLTSIRGQERQAFSGPRETQITQQLLAVEQAENQLNAARTELQRVQTLLEAGAVSRSAFEETGRAVTQLEILLAQQEQALKMLRDESAPPAGTREQFSGLSASVNAQIALLTFQKENATVVAPFDGVVSALSVREGDLVMPGMPLVSVFQPDGYEVDTFLLAEEMAGVKPGMSVRVIYRSAAGDEAYDGTIKRIAPAAVEKISTLGLAEKRVKVNVGLPGNVSGLRPGYNMDVEFITQREENRLVVPKTTLFPYDGGSAVWVVRGGKAVVQPVEKGLETYDEVVIASGLNDGDLVIRNPRLEGLKEGKRVTGQ